MSELIQSLVESLRQEAGHYRRLAALADQQRELLVAGKLESLPGNLRLEEKEVFELTPLVAARNGFLDKIAKTLGMEKIGLGEALEKSPADQAGELRAAVTELVRSARRLEEINRLNEKLLGNAMAEVKFTLRVIRNGGKAKSPAIPGAPEGNKPSYVNRVV